MKSIIKKVNFIICILILPAITVQAQFQPAVAVAEANCNFPPSLAVENTGNDIIDFNGDQIEVTVSDDLGNLNSGLTWSVNGGSSNYTNFLPINNIYDPDVAFTVVDNVLFAVTTYYVSGRYYYVEVFKWDGTNFNYWDNINFGTTLSGNFGTTVNIDCDTHGNFVVVFDDLGNIYAVPGFLNGSGYITCLNSPAEIQIGTKANGKYPDVALIETVSGLQVDFTYVYNYNSFDNIEMQYTMFGALLGPSTIILSNYLHTNPIYQTTNVSDELRFPRIACPNPNNVVLGSELTVVFEEFIASSSNYNIVGFNNFAPPYITKYNDGTNPNCPASINSNVNEQPVVTYDYTGSNVFIGWSWENTSTPPTSAKFPIVLKCGPHAEMYPGIQYLITPLALNTGDKDIHLSIAGRNSTSNVYSYYGVLPTSNVYFKNVPQSSSTLKPHSDIFSDNASLMDEREKLVLNNEWRYCNKIVANVTDVLGKEICSGIISYDELASLIRKLNTNSPILIYNIRLSAADGSLSECLRLALGK